MTSVNINLRKLEVTNRTLDRDARDYSPMIEAYKMLKEVDPDFKQLMGVQEKYYIKKK